MALYCHELLKKLDNYDMVILKNYGDKYSKNFQLNSVQSTFFRKKKLRSYRSRHKDADKLSSVKTPTIVELNIKIMKIKNK